MQKKKPQSFPWSNIGYGAPQLAEKEVSWGWLWKGKSNEKWVYKRKEMRGCDFVRRKWAKLKKNLKKKNKEIENKRVTKLKVTSKVKRNQWKEDKKG